MKEKSLRGQLTRAAMLTTFLAMLLSAGAVLAYELLTYRNAWVADLRTQADLISASTAAALVFNDPKVAQENLALLKTQPRIRAAAIYGAGGALVSTYVASPDEHAPGTAPSTVPRGVATFNGPTLELAYPIQQDGERVGTLYLRARHDIWSRLVGYAVILAVVMLGSLVLAFYVFRSLQRRVTTPIARMTEVAQEVMVSRNWALRAPETEYQDVRVLVDAFNGMLSECGTRTSELEHEMVIRREAEQELRRADRRKDEFLATLAHELRNPLAPMTGAVALIQMPTAAPAARSKALGILERQLRHMVRLIDDLLDASRIATGKLSLDRQPLDLSVLLRSSVELAQPMATQQQLQLSLELPEAILFVDGDAVRLAQVFSNLLNNACRYTRPAGRVDVTLEQKGGTVEIRIADTGIGVAADMQERIFELFEQVDKSLERGSAGLGIGLTLTRQLVELHGGSVSMSSAGLDQGSCFTVRLPLLKSVAAPDRAKPISPRPGQPLRILIADDNVDLTESFAELLRALGHLVEVVGDGEAAVQAARERVPDVALLDIGMPRRNGYEVARLLRSNPATRRIRLVAITGWGQASDKETAKQAGFDRHLLKPVDPDELSRVLVEVLGSGSEGDPSRGVSRP